LKKDGVIDLLWQAIDNYKIS